MARVRYGWRRFWCLPTASVALTPEGFLTDPEDSSLLPVSANPAAMPFDGIDEIPCLALLGEPGMGKSAEIANQAIQQRSRGDAVLAFHLRDYQSDLMLRHDIFEHPDFRSWAVGDGLLTLFLDGLDEGLLSIKQLATLLPAQLGRFPVDRLRLRIACRTAEWPSALDLALRELWGEERVGVYELLPLRLEDVAAVAQARAPRSDQQFLSEVTQQGLGPLAAKPVTLDLLLNLYMRQGGFPSTQADLYLRGCELLCEETDPGRLAAGRTGALDSRHRLAVAGRVAAVTVIGGRAAVWTAPDRGDVPNSDITIRALSGGNERAENAVFAVGESEIREVLGTGLFSSRGEGRLGWAHQTYAEFLAAWYLVANGVPIDRMLEQLLHEDGRVVPQLHEVAARVASLEPEFFRALLNADPLVLLRGDVANAAEQDRADLVATLLEAFDDGTLLDRDWGLRQFYRKLAHPGLAAQLRPYIIEPSCNPVARRAAADIAEACACSELQGELTLVALDDAETILLRMNAALAIARIGDAATRARLCSLATNSIPQDSDDELKGAALTAVWPDILPVEEMFAALTPPKNASLFGNYEAFLARHVASRLRIDDLTTALRWVERQPDRDSVPFGFRRVMDGIIERAWDHLDAPGVLPAFAAAALARLGQDEPIAGDTTNHAFRVALAADDDKRRRVLDAAVPLLTSPDRDWVRLVYPPTPLALAHDLAWMLDRLRAPVPEAVQRIWSLLIARVFAAYEWTAERVNAVLTACDEFPALAAELSWLVTPVTLGSPEAIRQKEVYEIQHGDRRQKRPLLQPSPAERVVAQLDRIESGDLDAWWQLNRDLTLEPDSTRYGSDFKTSLTITPGWRAADEVTRARIMAAAKRYVTEYEPDTSVWLGKNVLHYPSAAGYRALRLVLEEEPGYLTSIDGGCWTRWAPIVLGFPVFTADEEDGEEVQRGLVALAYRHAPDEILQTLVVLLHQQNAAREDVSILGKIAECWDGRLAAVLLSAAKDPAFTPRSQAALLEELLDHGSTEARHLAEILVSEAPVDQEAEERRFFSARLLLMHTADVGWSTVWPALQGDPAFGRRLIEAIAYADDRHTGHVATQLAEEQLAALYRWLVREYPPAEDPGFDASAEFTSMTPRTNVALWRDGLVGALKVRGTQEACTALEGLVNELPELEWLKWTLDEARAILRQETWLPARPEEIVRLAEEGRQQFDRERSASETVPWGGVTRRAIILTALPVEYQAVRHQLQNIREETHDQGTVYEIGTFSAGDRNWQVLIAEIGAGNTSAALEAERAITHFAPVIALFVGVAGGVKDVALGDVVVSTKIYGYEAGKDRANEFAPRPDVGESSYRLVQRARAEARKGDWRQRIAGEAAEVAPNALVGPIAAGEKVIGSARSVTATFLRRNYGDTLAVEMEGRGFLAAAHANASVAAIVIRGVSDLLSGKTQADRAGWQDRAARHASAFALEMLAKFE